MLIIYDASYYDFLVITLRVSFKEEHLSKVYYSPHLFSEDSTLHHVEKSRILDAKRDVIRQFCEDFFDD